jgi:transcriptional regulator with XRE-family HTH domain
MHFKDRIKTVRAKDTQAEFAEKLLVNITTIQKYEAGKSTPNAKVLQRIHEETGANLHWLLTGEGEPYNPGVRPELRAEEREGLWGDTKHMEVDGKSFSITEFSPSGPSKKHKTSSERADSDDTQELFGRAVEGLRRIFDSRDPQLISAIQANLRAFEKTAIKDQHSAKQAQKLHTLENKYQQLQDELNALKKQLEVKKGDV